MTPRFLAFAMTACPAAGSACVAREFYIGEPVVKWTFTYPSKTK